MSSGPQQAYFSSPRRLRPQRPAEEIAADPASTSRGQKSARPAGEVIKLRKLRIALASGGSMPPGRAGCSSSSSSVRSGLSSGARCGNLASRFDVIIFHQALDPRRGAAAVAAAARRRWAGRAAARARSGDSAQYQSQLGVTAAQTAPQLKKFDDGGRFWRADWR
jgi:hypothetical protein